MKNKSWQYPFPTLSDSFFDHNKNGKLDTFETLFRDMHLNETNQKSQEYRETARPKGRSAGSFDEELATTDSNKNAPSESNGEPWLELFVILLVIGILFGGFILAVSTKGTAMVSAIILFTAVGISIALLKSVGLYKGPPKD